MSVDDNRKKQAEEINKAFDTIGINLEITYQTKDGLGDRFIFSEKGRDDHLDINALKNKLDAAKASVAGTPKAVWLENLQDMVSAYNESGLKKGIKSFFGGKKVAENEATILGKFAETPEFSRLANSAANLSELKTVAWDLSASGIQSFLNKSGSAQEQKTGHDNLVNVARALTNIAEMNGLDIQFTVTKDRTVITSSGSLGQSEISDGVRSVLTSALLKDSKLRANSEALNSDGEKLLNSLTASTSGLNANALNASVVNLIENENILTALDRNNVEVTGADGNEVYRKEGAEKKNTAGAARTANTVNNVGRQVGLNRIPGLNVVRNELYQLNGMKNRAEALERSFGGGNKEIDPFEQGVKEAALINKLPVMIVEDASEPFVPPAGGGKAPAPKKGKGH